MKCFFVKSNLNISPFNFVCVFPQSLSMLLNGTPFAFVIDLAALASRREYLKLDKWLTDKIREHGVSLNFNQLPLLKIDGCLFINIFFLF